MTAPTTERVLRVVPWTAAFLACAALSLVIRGRSTTCLALTQAPAPALAMSAMPLVATPGGRRDRSSLFSEGHAWDQSLGPFRLDCMTTYDGHYWDYDHCALEVPACASRPLPFDRYGMFVTSLELHQAPDGEYVLGTAKETPYVAFRAEPTGHAVGVEPMLVAILALGLSFAALLVVRARRRQAAKLAGWQSGIVEPDGAVRPDDGGPPLPLASTGLEPMTSVLYAPPRATADYRTAREGIVAVSRREVARVDAVRRKSAALFVVVSIAASIGVVVAAVLGRQ